jgi:hypothetical protein
MLGFAILVTRIIVERFPETKALLRVGLAALLGMILLSIAKFIFDVLVLKSVPQGVLIYAGSFFIALGYALSGLVKSRIVRALISMAAVLTALAGSWWGHLMLARSGITMTPLFFYDYLWASSQVLITMIILALPMSIISNLGDLSPKNS